ncbi:flagellar basal-body MS-ring/collar protein FliF [Motiliproteus sp. MSK22-1]|uniref:flagellar basal-body MS-ring/collar protein FliF n=1 Tax=Motiliproteus sp. MSK22-1 TaxID=1897630 RepID=UPI000975CF16|nr:flagellar basal-body MS-ring/collar protein FliF [Motiliproteus sp. MSK22-1]OMH30033.1 flagellar M-ring protein FliF [Motiliproteus sp. MSK22-1]
MDNAPATTQNALAVPQSGLAAGFNRLGIFRQIGLMIGLAASVAIGFSVVLWSQEPEYRPLLNNLNSLDANQIIDTLQANQIPYRIDNSSGALMVAADQIHNARLKLAAGGLTGRENVGFELLDQEQALGTSQFMETTRFRRGLEGELARTISSLLPVKTARVHLAIPKRSVFVRDSRKPSASVFVELYAGRMMAKSQVASVASLVASSIPELDSRDVTVVDQKGRLLNSQSVDENVGLAAKQLEYSQKMEDRIASRVRNILEPVVGSGRFKAEVSADIDFTAIEQTDELFNPDLPSLRSEQTLDEQRAAGAGATGVPGALANQPPGAATVPEVGAAGGGGAAGANGQGSGRKQTTRNYELDRTISYTRHQQGRVRRLTVAVAVDDISTTNPDTGEVTRRPWSEADIQRLTLLVRDAVGYSAVRGDSVNVVNTPFVGPEPLEALPEVAIWEQPWFWDLARKVGAGLFLLLLVFGVLRPIMKSLSAAPVPAGEGGEIGGELEGIGEVGGLGDEGAGLSVDQGSLLPGPNESYDRQLDAIRSLIAEDPGRVAQVVKQWVSADE